MPIRTEPPLDSDAIDGIQMADLLPAIGTFAFPIQLLMIPALLMGINDKIPQ
ncbi:hypothetical protein [Cyanobium sp. Morenito 9A2]|uniref:hypothetical protein n=1 Tax=Cyanobium sp. Morenito 9A2 TaxID=2823718 RepID=UPI0020CBB586|nr:hypothetical protein [Cyanobium sp. Morenito 9A2]MCP9848874.1 hypothetical protein [Cyanobium sp. Morenito 9A2]